MKNVKENLDRQYRTFIQHDQHKLFFTGLAEYLNYALSEPNLKTVFITQINDRNLRYKKVAELEIVSLKEKQKSKQKLLKIITDAKIDTSSFTHISVMRMPPWENDVLGQLAAFENGDFRYGSKFKSDILGTYLLEIATNLRRLGHQDKLKSAGLLVSDEEYSQYRGRISDDTASDEYFGEQFGKFIFSRTLAQRREQEALIERERHLGPWGPFEMLFRFKVAYDEAAKNKNFWSIINSPILQDDWRVLDDISQIAHMVSELLNFLAAIPLPSFAQGNDSRARTPDEVYRHLRIKSFRLATETVHNRLMALGDSTGSPLNTLSSIHLVTRSISEQDPVFMVLDAHYESPIRFSKSNNKAIRNLYDIAYFVDVPGKSVQYTRMLSNAINNDLFKIKRIRDYMRAHGLTKPKLVKKAGDRLVLENQTEVKTFIVTKVVPEKDKSLYFDKTK